MRRPARVLGAAVLAAATVLAAAGPGAAQYAEPFPRRPGVSLPAAHADALAEEARRLGFPPPGVLPGPSRVERLGTRPMIVIPALFADSPDPHLAPEAIQTSLFDGPTPRGTVGDFYSDQSGGRFTIVGEVAPWVRTSVTLAEAAGTDGTFGPRVRDWVREAVTLADATVDFGRFDDDGPDGVPNSGDDDGTVDGIAVHYIEVAGSCGGPGVWPHLSGLFDAQGRPYATNDLRPDGQPVVIQVYIADSAVDCEGVEVQGPEIMAHEIGHLLGLGDWYRQAEGIQPWQRHWNVGCFDTMGAGSWGCGTGPKVLNFGPTGLSAVSRAALGWATLEPVGAVTDEELVLEPLGTGFRAFEVPLTDDGTESFIVEYRPRTGYDRHLPAGGILVYHGDKAAFTRVVPPELPPAYGYHLVEADGDDALRKVERLGGNRGVASDVFARDGAVDSILDTTSPSTRDHLGRPTRVRFHALRVEDGTGRVRLSTRVGFAVVERVAPAVVQGGRPFVSTFRLGGATLPLEVTQVAGSELPGGVEVNVRDDEVDVIGTVVEPGAFLAELRVRDAAGREVVERMGARVSDPEIDELALVGAVAGLGPGVSPPEADFLDNAGNRNGRLDVGDVRASLIRRRILDGPGG